MTALDGARRVLRWALLPNGAPPAGDLLDLHQVIEPPDDTLALLGDVAAVSAAKLGLRPGDEGRVGPASVWLASAIGSSRQPVATEIPRCCDRSTSFWDEIARHGVVDPALDHVPRTLRRELVEASPLTGLLDAPAEGEEDRVLERCVAYLGVEGGERLLTLAFSRPDVRPQVMRWRASLLQALRRPQRDFVVGVYEAAVAVHGSEWIRRIHQARAILARDASPSEEDRAFAVAEWWNPLRMLRRTHSQALTERPYLDFRVYLEGIRLSSSAARLRPEDF